MTFWAAQERARAASGKLILRIEDLDRARCQTEFGDAIVEDLRWFGLRWDEGPSWQSERIEIYRAVFDRLRADGFVYPCVCSRKDVLHAAAAPHDENEEPIYPGTCRSRREEGGEVTWRFRVPDGEEISFVDQGLGERRAVAGRDFGDFVLWRRDDVPSYQLAVTVDDAAMKITEVVRGEDLLISTFRQLLLYRALHLAAPNFRHLPLLVDETGKRLAKRHASLSLRALRERGETPENLRRRCAHRDRHQ